VKAAPSVAGEFDLGASADATRAIMANMINGSATGAESATGYFDIATAGRNAYSNKDIVAVNDDTANTLTITGRGRLAVSETFTATADVVNSNVLHAYFGKRGAIDLVVQDMKEVDMRKTDDRRGYNIFRSYLAGLKTFDDGAKKFLDVLINAA